MIAKIHIAKKDLSLTDDTYRDLLNRVAGRVSSKACTDRQLDAVLKEFRVLGWRPRKPAPKRRPPPSRRPADTPQAFKIRALWSSLYLMGEVETRDESALAKFVRRQTDVDDPQWMTGEQGSDVIEALKDWCRRAGFEPTGDWRRQVKEWRLNGGLPAASFGHCAKILLVSVLWEKLINTGCMKFGAHARLDTWLMKKQMPRSTHLLTEEHAHQATEELGVWLRKELSKQKEPEHADA